jgi:hypothetical protein
MQGPFLPFDNDYASCSLRGPHAIDEGDDAGPGWLARSLDTARCAQRAVGDLREALLSAALCDASLDEVSAVLFGQAPWWPHYEVQDIGTYVRLASARAEYDDPWSWTLSLPDARTGFEYCCAVVEQVPGLAGWLLRTHVPSSWQPNVLAQWTFDLSRAMCNSEYQNGMCAYLLGRIDALGCYRELAVDLLVHHQERSFASMQMTFAELGRQLG